MIKTVKIALFLNFAILIFLLSGCTENSKTTKKTEKPIFSKTTGVYLDSVELSINSNTDGAEIFYTFDDTEPNKIKGIKYEKLFNIIKSTTVKAIAIKEGYENSEVVSAFYKINKTPAIPLIPTEQVSTSTMAIKITIPEGETYVYTTDGTEPTLENGVKVNSELTFSKTTKLKIRSFSKDGIGSKTIDAVFRVLNLKEIKIDSKPLKEKYFKGDKFDITGLKVKAIYSDEEISQE